MPSCTLLNTAAMPHVRGGGIVACSGPDGIHYGPHNSVPLSTFAGTRTHYLGVVLSQRRSQRLANVQMSIRTCLIRRCIIQLYKRGSPPAVDWRLL
jgi:hypothetical protein